jgi:hypothetical protein
VSVFCEAPRLAPWFLNVALRCVGRVLTLTAATMLVQRLRVMVLKLQLILKLSTHVHFESRAPNRDLWRIMYDSLTSK